MEGETRKEKRRKRSKTDENIQGFSSKEKKRLSSPQLHVDIPTQNTYSSDENKSSPETRKKKKTPSAVKVHNKLKVPVWVSVYYKPIIWGDLKRYTEAIEILPSEKAEVARPNMQKDRTRKLVVSLTQEELELKLSIKAVNRLEVTGVDFDDEIFIDYRKDESFAFFKGYNIIQYQQRKRTKGVLSNSSANVKLEKKSSSPIIRSLRRSLGTSNSLVLRDNQLSPARLDDTVLISNTNEILVTGREELCSGEQNFLEKREPITRKAIENFLQVEENSLDPTIIPRIGLTGSGGGARAMLCTIGVLEGLSEIGVEDCLTYVAGLSGSTWAFSVWHALRLSTSELHNNVRYKFENGHMITPTTPVFPELKNILLSKFIYDHSKVSTINDCYAAQLSVHLFRDTEPKASKLTFTDLISSSELNNGLYPFPIFVSAIQEPNTQYEWFEFTPYTVGCSKYNCFIPTCLFGSKFTNGKLKYPNEEPHEICLAYLLATFASAFCAPWRRVADEFFEKLEVQPVSIFSEIYEYRGRFNELLTKLKLSHNHAIEPPLFRNFMYGMASSPLRKFKYFPLVDAGIDFNIPLPPLLEPLRGVDIIIASNASRTPEIAENYSLKCMEKYASRMNLKFPPIDYEKEESGGKQIYEKPWSIFFDENDPDCPIVIYLPLSKNPEYKEDFDPQENARIGGYCGTFNFDINPEQFDEITGLTKFNTTQIKDILKWAITKKMEQKSNNVNKIIQ